MKFAIHMCSVSPLRDSHATYEDFSDAISHTFGEMDDFYMLWNHVPVQLSYKYDLPVILPDVVEMVEWALQGRNGDRRIRWGSSTFDAIWNLNLLDGEIRVSSEWLVVVGDLEPHLNNRSMLVVPLESFLAEWASLLRVSLNALDKTGALLVDESEAVKARALVERVPQRGAYSQGRKD
jgi:hypothetical protein